MLSGADPIFLIKGHAWVALSRPSFARPSLSETIGTRPQQNMPKTLSIC